MSSTYASTGSLLRKPRPSPHPSGYTAALSMRSIDSNTYEMNMSIQSRISPGMRLMPSLASHRDGLQSPVPTMQSEYDTVRYSQRSNQHKGESQNQDSDNTTIGDTSRDSMSKKGLVLPYKPRGPDPFPMREPKRPADVKREYIVPKDSPRLDPEFTLEDFLQTNKNPLQKNELKSAVLSRANYRKLTLLLQKELIQNQSSVKTIDAAKQAEIVTQQRRVPKAQLIVEMKAIVQDRLRDLGVTSPGKFAHRKSEVNQLFGFIQEMGEAEGIDRKSQLALFNKASSTVFEASRRKSGSVFDGENTESIITPSELSILNCLMEGGYVLSLKAHFIPQIPELSPLSTTLVYLNLSFNELTNFPREVLACRELQVLKLRNNPLKDLPHDISKLRKLRTLILSFCCLTAIPLSVYSLTNLEFFDVSYNKLTFLSSEIKKLERLRFLNVEGNELPGLPCGLLRLNLFRIRVRNNFMSPAFWKENSVNDPLTLADMCLLVLKTNVTNDNPSRMRSFPPEIVRSISSFQPCDCCSNPRFGQGLRIIRPCTEIWGIKRLPFIFQSCSPSCYSIFIHNTDPKIMEIIYGIPDDKPPSPLPVEQIANDDESIGKPPSPREGAITA